MSKPQFRRIITTLRQRWHIPEYNDYLTERYWPAFSQLDDAGQRAFWQVLGEQAEHKNIERRLLMPYVTIEVLQEDMDRALRDPRLRARPDRFCPVARATCRALGLALRNVQIGGNPISVWG